MEFLQDHWGDLFSVAGLIVSALGFVWAIKVAYGAKTAAESAEQATVETRSRIRRNLTIIDIERANSRIETLKSIHRRGQWESALVWYPELRTMLHDIRAHRSDSDGAMDESIIAAVIQIMKIENLVERGLQSPSQLDSAEINQILSEIQSSLRQLPIDGVSENGQGEA